MFSGASLQTGMTISQTLAQLSPAFQSLPVRPLYLISPSGHSFGYKRPGKRCEIIP